ncbi:protein ren [Atlantibacter subterranea]|uniref:Protein ren n=1 Tax=Atlantibacter subterraneus TaxID=255519 RepID=A0A427UNQ9_9ENTR|nr:protein ren [Atlantibacter subterranea]RSB59012.1 protein ren [Atlantibacter subterranea]RSE01181.1 protein ren [Atlantibacter subterranea]RSE22141.1 protein ren [Atlantibacter subterranea]
MTGRQAILQYLAGRNTFTPSQVAQAVGVPVTRITAAANVMCQSGELILVSRQWRGNTYQRPMANQRSINTIFDECRNSDAMQRVLSVYGRVQA